MTYQTKETRLDCLRSSRKSCATQSKRAWYEEEHEPSTEPPVHDDHKHPLKRTPYETKTRENSLLNCTFNWTPQILNLILMLRHKEATEENQRPMPNQKPHLFTGQEEDSSETGRWNDYLQPTLLHDQPSTALHTRLLSCYTVARTKTN